MKPQTMETNSAVGVWHASSSVASPGPVEMHCEAWLDAEERVRADRFRQPTSRNQHVVGRGMARQLLGSDCVDPKSIQFAAATHGKPYVTSPIEAKRPFNVAHTNGLVMCGIGNTQSDLVGVDVEKLDRRTDPALADRYFSEPEVLYLKQFESESDRRNAFLRVWTLKESFIKAIGTGLHTPLADFAFEDIDSETPTIRMLNPELDSDIAWSFFSIQPRPGFIGAVAVGCQTQRLDVKVQMHRFDDLIV
ncbi:MAG: 4'-phosphopantetheinyl transferase family protein [Rubripirellula sp.]